MKIIVIEIKNSREEVKSRLEMREERASEFEDRLIEIKQSEEQRGKDWNKINIGSDIHTVRILVKVW